MGFLFMKSLSQIQKTVIEFLVIYVIFVILYCFAIHIVWIFDESIDLSLSIGPMVCEAVFFLIFSFQMKLFFSQMYRKLDKED